jgi:hypothetical protein
MNENNHKSLHIHIGGLIIFVIIVLILLKIDLKSFVQSPQFQKNVDYIEEKVKNVWQNDIVKFIKNKAGKLIMNIAEKGTEKIQEGISENLLTTPFIGNTENVSN